MMGNESERTWKVKLGDYPGYIWRAQEKPGKTSVRMAGVPDGIRTEYLPNTNRESYRYTILFGCNSSDEAFAMRLTGDGTCNWCKSSSEWFI
jgi:hypothetical protein